MSWPSARLLIRLCIAVMLASAGGCLNIQRSATPPQFATCSSRVAVAQVLDRRTLRLSDGKVVELVNPQLFLSVPSPEQADYFALNEELVHYLKTHLEGRTVSVDLADSTLALCGEDGVALGTGLVAQGLLYLEQVTGPLEAGSRESWLKLEALARQQQRGLWKKGLVGKRPFDRVARLTHLGLTGEQTLDEISADGTLLGKGKKLTLNNIESLREMVANSAIALMPRSPNFWQLCCNVGGSWFRVYYPRQSGAPQTADYIESAELETFFRRIFDDQNKP